MLSSYRLQRERATRQAEPPPFPKEGPLGPAVTAPADRVALSPMELPVGYHRDDFLLLLDHGDSLNGYRLGQEEKAFSAALRSRSLAAHRLYVRLASHKGPLFRSERLHYGEIGNVSDPAAELEAAGLLANDRPSDVRDALGLLRRGELLDARDADRLGIRIGAQCAASQALLRQKVDADPGNGGLKCSVFPRDGVLGLECVKRFGSEVRPFGLTTLPQTRPMLTRRKYAASLNGAKRGPVSNGRTSTVPLTPSSHDRASRKIPTTRTETLCNRGFIIPLLQGRNPFRRSVGLRQSSVL